jgi:hypothetical protein
VPHQNHFSPTRAFAPPDRTLQLVSLTSTHVAQPTGKEPPEKRRILRYAKAGEAFDTTQPTREKTFEKVTEHGCESQSQQVRKGLDWIPSAIGLIAEHSSRPVALPSSAKLAYKADGSPRSRVPS